MGVLTTRVEGWNKLRVKQNISQNKREEEKIRRLESMGVLTHGLKVGTKCE